MRVFPRLFGGGPDEADKAYSVLRTVIGKGGPANTEDGIDGLWRRTRALGIASGTSAYRRATFQAFPSLATDLVDYYERALGVTASDNDTEVSRRGVVAALWPSRAGISASDIENDLKKIDSRFMLITPNEATQTVTCNGRTFGDDDAESPFGAAGFSALGFFSSRAILRVRFEVNHSPLTATERRSLTQSKTRLGVAVSAWVDFTVTTSTGFIPGVSPLGLTGLAA